MDGAWPFSNGASTTRRHQRASASGDGPPKNANRPRRSSRPRETGVPVTAHLCTPGTRRAMAAAAAVEDSTSCASSKTTRHHVNRVSGVGMTSYFFRCLLARPVSKSASSRATFGAWCRSLRSVSYVVSTTSARARSSAETGASRPRERVLAFGPEAPRGWPS